MKRKHNEERVQHIRSVHTCRKEKESTLQRNNTPDVLFLFKMWTFLDTATESINIIYSFIYLFIAFSLVCTLLPSLVELKQ